MHIIHSNSTRQLNVDKPLEDDSVLVAFLDDRPIAIVRVSVNEGLPILRGMFVLDQFQRIGIGSKMLFELENNFLGRDAYCLPYIHLIDFYGQIGFQVIETKDAPVFLQQRLEVYSKRFEGLLLMKRPAKKQE